MNHRKHYRSITDGTRADTRPNYRKAIEAALKDSVLVPAPGTVSVIETLHDDGCAIFQGEPCDCDPDIIQKQNADEMANKAIDEPAGQKEAETSYITRAEAAKLEEDILNQVRSYSDKGRARAEKALQELIQEVAQMTG